MSKLYKDINDLPVANAILSNVIQAEVILADCRTHIDTDDLLVSFPPGLKKIIEDSSEACATRYWIVDNSSSMMIPDGKIIQYKNGKYIHRNVSRYQELIETLKWHGRMATKLNAKTVFYALNKPNSFTTNRIEVTNSSGLDELYRLCNTSPSGNTPLCATLREVITDIRKNSASLCATNKKVTVIVATDGESSDGDIAPVLEELKSLPCMCVIIRLCTDDDRIQSYWNAIDNIVELELDVLDDHIGEAEQICKYNSWLTYSQEIQRVREWGTSEKLFDLLDERPFFTFRD